MTVAELIAVLQTYPPTMKVAIDSVEDYVLVDKDMVKKVVASEPDSNGYISAYNPSFPAYTYVVLTQFSTFDYYTGK